MIDFKTISHKLKERREFLAYTQADVAELTGISERTIRSIEKGNGGTSILNWLKILDILGLEMKIVSKPMSDETRRSFLQ